MRAARARLSPHVSSRARGDGATCFSVCAGLVGVAAAVAAAAATRPGGDFAAAADAATEAGRAAGDDAGAADCAWLVAGSAAAALSSIVGRPLPRPPPPAFEDFLGFPPEPSAASDAAEPPTPPPKVASKEARNASDILDSAPVRVRWWTAEQRQFNAMTQPRQNFGWAIRVWVNLSSEATRNGRIVAHQARTVCCLRQV